MRKLTIFAVSIALTSFVGSSFVSRVLAQEIVIENNGSGATSEVNTQAQSSTTVAQDNSANVNNTSQTTLDTGNNEANANTGGETNIQTGDAQANQAIENNLNASYVDAGVCCVESSSQTISSNGSNTTNTITTNVRYSNNINVNQTASITNNINGSANTGGNTASNNNGDVSIKTGDIKVKELISNMQNIAYVKAAQNQNGVNINIKNNGVDSENTVLFTLTNDFNVVVNNHSDIFNNSFWDLVTGNNIANGNNGDVSIETGDIDFEAVIGNTANVSYVDIECCEDKGPENPEPEKPGPTEPGDKDKPSTSTGGGSVGSSNGSSSGGTPLAAIGQVLPATGTGWMFFALLANIVMLLIGSVLRLRSGRSPDMFFRFSI